MNKSTSWALAAIAVLAMGSAHAAQAGSKTGGTALLQRASAAVVSIKGLRHSQTRRRTQP